MKGKILLDKAPFPQAKVTGEWATQKALKRLQEAIARLKRELE
ncbi:hypothetical protein [Aneurinibacillus tyrosinisolvens]|nr:hypothetical protein [Aneurinibacillus tyrosinisolvens]